MLVPFFGKKQLQGITVQDVETYRREWGKDRAMATVNGDDLIPRDMLKHAMRRDLVMRNVASLVVKPTPDNARNRVLDREERSRLYEAAPAWFKPVLLNSYHTEMRLEEILKLEWDRVDLEKHRIYIPKHLAKTNVGRHVPITPTLRRELYRLKTQDGVIRFHG